MMWVFGVFVRVSHWGCEGVIRTPLMGTLESDGTFCVVAKWTRASRSYHYER